jgi:hypothetical protein
MHGFENGGFEEEGFNCGFWIVDCGLTLLFFVLVWPRQKQPRIAQINTDYFHHKRHKSNHEFTQINTNFSDTDLHRINPPHRWRAGTVFFGLAEGKATTDCTD